MPSGGRREGSGRKPAAPESKRVQIVVTVDPSTKDKLAKAAKERGVKVGRLLDMIASTMN